MPLTFRVRVGDADSLTIMDILIFHLRPLRSRGHELCCQPPAEVSITVRVRASDVINGTLGAHLLNISALHLF